MRFRYPLSAAEFEIPDSWWYLAGMLNFEPRTTAYRSTRNAELLELRHIEPPFRFFDYTESPSEPRYRFPECPKYYGPFERDQLINVLKAILNNKPMHPVQLHPLTASRASYQTQYRFQLSDDFYGFYHFHAAVAAGFELLPVRRPHTPPPRVRQEPYGAVPHGFSRPA